jgi:hypothetical protein
VCRIELTRGGGFAEDEDAICAGRLIRLHPNRPRCPRQFRRKKPQRETDILHQEIFVADAHPLGKSGGIAATSQAQSDFQYAQSQEWQAQRA